jgi:predicted DNA-binding transcriptional regulator AlpA
MTVELSVADADDLDWCDVRETCRIMGGTNSPWAPSTLWRRVREQPDFPRPVRTGPNQIRFIRRELIEAKRRMVVERDDPVAQAEAAQRVAKGNEARARARTLRKLEKS